MLHRLETREAYEAALTAEMTAILRRKMAADYERGDTRRDAHPKTVGLVRGKFVIERGLPEELQVGVFAKPRSFDCWVRFSNSSGKIQSDAIPDARGVAIKLLPSRGKRGADDKPQDFILLNTPVMPLGTVALFRDAVYYAIESSAVLFAAKLALTGKAGVLLDLLGLRSNPNSLLDIRYWSTTPYRFGKDDVVKYSLLPTSRYKSKKPAELGDSYLSDAMQAHLSKHPASFDFCVQLRKDGMPIEDAAVRWDERKSRFLKVATLQIPKQAFRNKTREASAEELSFSPGHAWPPHRPLGGLNRARIKIYAALSKFRHTRDARTDIS